MNNSSGPSVRPSTRHKASVKAKRCTHCDRTFTKEEHLKRHERSHTGERPFKCHKCHKRYARSDVLARHLQTHPDASRDVWSQANTTSIAESQSAQNISFTDNADIRRSDGSLVEQRHLDSLFARDNQSMDVMNEERNIVGLALEYHNLNNRPGGLALPTSLHDSDAQQANHLVELGASRVSNLEAASLWSHTAHGSLGGAELPAQLSSATGPGASDENNYDPDHPTGIEPLPARLNPGDLNQKRSHSSRWQAPYEKDPDRTLSVAAHELDHRHVTETSSSTLQTSTFRNNGDPVPPHEVLGLDRPEQIAFTFDLDFGPNDSLSPGISDFLDFGTAHTPLSANHPSSNATSASSDTFFSVDQMQRMRHVWRSRQRTSSTRVVRSIWHDVVQHEANNLFSRFRSPETVSNLLPTDGSKDSRWGVDGGCTERLWAFCKMLDNTTRQEDVADLTPRSMSGMNDADAGHGGPSTVFFVDGFPTKEILGATLDMFFRRCPLSFIQKSTFDAKLSPDPLLLAMHLIGCSLLYPERAKSFVLHYQKALMFWCRSDLTSKVPGHCRSWDLLVSIATTLLIVYLGLDYLEQIDEGQPHILCIQMLHISERHGLFAASEGDDPCAQLQAGSVDTDELWKAWSRIESTKRMISCLLWIDMAYARVMGGAGVLDIDKVELYLPDATALFEATTSSRFFQISPDDVLVKMPRVSVRTLQMTLSPVLDHMAMETLLVALYLRIAAIRHKTPVGPRQSHLTWSVISDEDFSLDGKTGEVVSSLLALPSRSATLFQQRHRVTAFAWNNVCISLTADLNLLEIASGRDGIDEARAAMSAVSTWSQTSRARRATLHAAQIFDILSSSRLTEWNIARPDLLLYHSGLVLSMYLFVCDCWDEDEEASPFELLQSIDWDAVGQEGLPGSAQASLSFDSSLNERMPSHATNVARKFILHGGPLSFSGDVLSGGSLTARKILLNYVHLLDEIGKYRGSSYSQILKTMSDFVIESNQGH